MFSPSGSSFLLLSVFDLNENFDQDFFLQKIDRFRNFDGSAVRWLFRKKNVFNQL